MMIMKIHSVYESERFILLTFRWLTICLRLIAYSFKQNIKNEIILFDENFFITHYIKKLVLCAVRKLICVKKKDKYVSKYCNIHYVKN